MSSASHTWFLSSAYAIILPTTLWSTSSSERLTAPWWHTESYGSLRNIIWISQDSAQPLHYIGSLSHACACRRKAHKRKYGHLLSHMCLSVCIHVQNRGVQICIYKLRLPEFCLWNFLRTLGVVVQFLEVLPGEFGDLQTKTMDPHIPNIHLHP